MEEQQKKRFELYATFYQKTTEALPEDRGTNPIGMVVAYNTETMNELFQGSKTKRNPDMELSMLFNEGIDLIEQNSDDPIAAVENSDIHWNFSDMTGVKVANVFMAIRKGNRLNDEFPQNMPVLHSYRSKNYNFSVSHAVVTANDIVKEHPQYKQDFLQQFGDYNKALSLIDVKPGENTNADPQKDFAAILYDGENVVFRYDVDQLQFIEGNKVEYEGKHYTIELPNLDPDAYANPTHSKDMMEQLFMVYGAHATGENEGIHPLAVDKFEKEEEFKQACETLVRTKKVHNLMAGQSLSS
jgi:hypothetical protein